MAGTTSQPREPPRPCGRRAGGAYVLAGVAALAAFEAGSPGRCFISLGWRTSTSGGALRGVHKDARPALLADAGQTDLYAFGASQAAREPLIGGTGRSAPTGLAAVICFGFACVLAARSRRVGMRVFESRNVDFRHAEGRGDNELRIELKRRREHDFFYRCQERLITIGVPERTDRFWKREEELIFAPTKNGAGINFDAYDDIPVERNGGQGIEEPCETFKQCCEQFDVPQELVDNLNRCGYDKPTPVQKHAMPAALQGTDVMVAAQTGSGKTAAFLMPCVAKSLKSGKQPLEEGPLKPSSLILTPTRELCQQITMEARKFCFRTTLRTVAIYGGEPAIPQIRAMAEGPDIVVCTPGRMEDFLDRGIISVENVRSVVLDEADRMLDMGFEPAIRQIIDGHNMPVPGHGEGCRQTMMFSATFPDQIKDMALDYLDPTYLWIGVGRVGSTVSSVEQRFEDVSTTDQDGKFDALVNSLNKVDGKTLVFANTKVAVDDTARKLSRKGIRAVPIHGGLTQVERDRALALVRASKARVLVATDVASRGLDLPGVDHVVNYELPLNGEDYVHRIGRTGRIGNAGISTSFVTRFEPALRDIVRKIQEEIEEDASKASALPSWVEERADASTGRTF